MRKIIILIVLVAFLPIMINSHGIGLVGGYPGGIVFRWDLQEKNALDFYLDYYWSHFAIAGDFVMKKDTKLGEFPVQLFYGGGIGMIFFRYEHWEYDGYYHWQTKTAIYPSIRGKFGVSYFIKDMPIEIFIELGPRLSFGEYIDTFGFNGGAGFRYRF